MRNADRIITVETRVLDRREICLVVFFIGELHGFPAATWHTLARVETPNYTILWACCLLALRCDILPPRPECSLESGRRFPTRSGPSRRWTAPSLCSKQASM